MATHSSILAWKIPWTEESGGLQYMRLQRFRCNWACMCLRNTSKTHSPAIWISLVIYPWPCMMSLFPIRNKTTLKYISPKTPAISGREFIKLAVDTPAPWRVECHVIPSLPSNAHCFSAHLANQVCRYLLKLFKTLDFWTLRRWFQTGGHFISDLGRIAN